MAIYVAYLILAGIQLPLFYRKDELGTRQLRRKAYLAVCCAELIFLAGLRGYTVGADTEVYLQSIDYYSKKPLLVLVENKFSSPFHYELGYLVLTQLSAALGLGRTGFLFLVAFIIYIPVFRVIMKHSEMPYISILCYFAFGMFSYSLGIFRQMIAISILLCGWRYVVERHLVKYILVVALAASFHTTALIALALYFLYGIQWKRIIWFVPVIELCLLFFGRPIILVATKLLPQYAGYLGSQYDLSGGSYKMLLLLNAVLIACIIFRDKDSSRDDMVICALILAACVQAVGYSMALFGRMVPYFSTYILFAVPNVLKRIDKRFRPFLVVGAVAALFFLVFMEFNGNKYVTPYYTFFDQIQ